MKLIGNIFVPLLRRHVRWVRLALVVVTVCIAGPAVSVSADVLHQYAYDITGYIDTADYLIIQNSTLQWHHTGTGAAVGRHAGNNFPTIISSSPDGVSDMDAVDWTPDWPDPVPNEIRFDAYSSTFSLLDPAIPEAGALSVTTSVISGRGSLSISQLPDDTNGNTTIVQFKDGFNGSANLDALITITQVPEPGALAVLAFGGGMLCCRHRCRRGKTGKGHSVPV